ncbi:MAG: AsmA-like C-terminal region-containing protein [Bacteroidetes bacterium]|nr:AsmA-like C-terminal region-containing protein [Bacteroidota bacterium]
MANSTKKNLKLAWQFVKIALISGFVFILVVFIALSLLAWIYRDTIKEAFINELNKNIKTEASIGNIGVNFFRSFPLVSVTLNDVVVLENAPKLEKDTLLSARRIYFQFNLLDVLKKQYEVKELEVSLAEFNPVIFKDGTVNYLVWESEKSDDSEASMVFDFQRVILKRVRINYNDYFAKLHVSFLTHKADLKGLFKESEYNLAIVGELFTENIKYDDTEYVAFQETKVDLLLDVFENKLFIFRQGGVVINKHEFDVTGEVDFRGQFTFLDITVASDRLKIQNLISDLPDFVQEYFQDYRVKGDIVFKTKISGTFSNVVNPFISAEFSVTNAEVSDRKKDVRMKNLSFNGKFNNGRFRNLSSSALVLKDFSTQLNNGFLEGELFVLNFNRPDIEMSIKSNIEIADIIDFFKIEFFQNPLGILNLELSFSGSISNGKEFRPIDFVNSSSRGKLSFNNVSFKLKDDKKEYNNFSGVFNFNNNDLVVESLSGKVSASDFNLKGNFRNFLSYLFFENQKLFVDANFKANHINLNELLFFESKGKETTYKLSFSDKLDFSLGATINNVVFRNFEANNVKGSLYLSNKFFMAEDVSLNAMGGKVFLAGTIDGKNEDLLKVRCVGSTENVEIQQLFYQMNNFGQQEIMDKHIKGKLNSTIQFSGNWSPHLDVDLKTIEANADLKIDNGELINYEPVLKLSRFIKIGDLEHIKFSTLENKISIKDETINIPFMEINSNAINIKLSGEHKFNNDINYRLQVLLSDVLARKNRQNRNPQEQYGDIIDDGNKTTLYILVTGNISNPVFKYDRKTRMEKVREDLKEERKTLLDIFRKEFKITKDTILEETPPEEVQKIKEKREVKKREEGNFIIEWD